MTTGNGDSEEAKMLRELEVDLKYLESVACHASEVSRVAFEQAKVLKKRIKKMRRDTGIYL